MIRDSAKKQFDVVLVWKLDRFSRNRLDAATYRKAIIDTFVNSIFLYDDKLVITFNWKDGSKTVSLAELESAADAGGSNGDVTDYTKVLNINNFRCSHLDDNAPPFCDKSELMPIGDGFGFVHFVKW